MNANFWCVSPVTAADVVTYSGERDEGELLTATHNLTSVMYGADDLASKLIDRLVRFARSNRVAWQDIDDLMRVRTSIHTRNEQDVLNAERRLLSEYNSILQKYDIGSAEVIESAHISQEEVDIALKERV